MLVIFPISISGEYDKFSVNFESGCFWQAHFSSFDFPQAKVKNLHLVTEENLFLKGYLKIADLKNVFFKS